MIEKHWICKSYHESLRISDILLHPHSKGFLNMDTYYEDGWKINAQFDDTTEAQSLILYIERKFFQ